MDSFTTERRVIKRLLRSERYQEEIFKESFNMESMVGVALERKFLFSNWLKAFQKALCNESENVEEIGIILDLFVYVADYLDDIQDGSTRIEDGIQLNEAILILLCCIDSVEAVSLPLEMRELLKKTFMDNYILALVGQQLDLKNETKLIEDYLRMAEKKAGTFFKLAANLALSVSKDEVEQALWDEANLLSNSLGIYHQMLNDLEDFLSLGEDIKNKRRTLPVIYTLNDSDLLLTQYYYNNLSYKELKAKELSVRNEIETSGVISFCQYYLLYYETQIKRIIGESHYLKKDNELLLFIMRRN